MYSSGVDSFIDTGSTSAPATEQVTLFTEDFSNGSGTFSYSDSTGAATGSSGFVSNNDDYEAGAHSSSGGETGGGLTVTLGGLDDNDVQNMGGDWTTTINVAETTTNAQVTFSYRMIYPANSESDEAGEVRFSLNGTQIGSNGNDYVHRTVGDGDSGTGTQDSGWQTVTLDLGTLAAGSHTISLQGWYEQKTASNEELEIFFDNFSLTGEVPVDGNDTISGGAGDDTIYAGHGDDTVDGGTGDDTIDLSGDTAGGSAAIVSHWKLEETSGGSVSDSVGSNNGNVAGGTVLDFTGNYGSGADFDGSSDYIEIPHNSSMQVANGSFALSFNGSSQQNTLLSKGDNGDNPGEFQLSTRSGGTVRFQYTDDNGDSVTIEGGSINWDQWNDVVVSWGANGIELYVNGSLADSDSSVTNGLDTNDKSIKIGARDDGGDGFNGTIDDVALFSEQLSADDVQSIADNGVDGYFEGNVNTATGGDGDDTLIGGEGEDHLDGGVGDDTLSYANSEEAVTIDFQNGTVSGGDAQDDTIANFENAIGSNYDDTITGDSGANRLDGGLGADRLSGGDGSDVFVLGPNAQGIDTIVDFDAAEGDKIDVSSLIDMDSVDNVDNYLRLEEDQSGNTTVKVNTSGDGTEENFEAVATLEGVTGLDINSIVQDQNNGGEVV